MNPHNYVIGERVDVELETNGRRAWWPGVVEVTFKSGNAYKVRLDTGYPVWNDCWLGIRPAEEPAKAGPSERTK